MASVPDFIDDGSDDESLPKKTPATVIESTDKPNALPANAPPIVPVPAASEQPTMENRSKYTVPNEHLKPIRIELWNWDKLKKSMDNVPSPSALSSHLSILPKDPRFRKRAHHFYIKHEQDRQRLIEMLKDTYGERLTVQMDDPMGQHTSDYEKNDIHLRLDNQEAGEIQFLLCNVPDIGTPSKYYIHVYLQKFLDEAFFTHVQSVLPRFFQSITPHSSAPSLSHRKKRTHSARPIRVFHKTKKSHMQKRKKFETRRRPRYRVR